jgi:UDP-glucose 4-epimerase
LVTGGAGFIGSTLVDRLLAEGLQVHAVDDLSTGSLANLASARAGASRSFTFNQLDVRSDAMVEIVLRTRPDVIYHLAAQPDVRGSIDRPRFDAEVNVLGTLRVLEGARATGDTRVVFAASGGSLYGEVDPSDLPARESSDHRPISPHGVSKKAAVDYLFAYRELHSVEFCALALSNVYGPRQDPHGGAGVVAVFAERLAREEPLVVYGDGGQVRDFVYVDDAVDALVRASERGGGLLLNVSTGRATTVNELARLMSDEAGVSNQPRHEPERHGELRRSVLDPGRASLHLGWSAWTSLEEGVRQVIAHRRVAT